MRFLLALTALAAIGFMTPTPSTAQNERPGANAARPPEFESPTVGSDKKITFRILAPKAESVRVSSSDIPNTGRGIEMKKSAQGVWEGSVGPVDAGAYRYNFNVDGVSVIDPKNPATSESNANTWSLVYVSGSETSDLKDVPHGAVASVSYYSQSLKRFRRMHVYTPPGYEKGEGRYPVFYLLHGAFDCDASWNTVGRAGIIVDNLIAAGKAKPMIIVMPAGHTGAFRFGPGRGNNLDRQVDEFSEDFLKDLKPLVEKTYRVKADKAHRAIAGLSMGGAQTLNIAIPHLDEYSHIGVFSSGVFGISQPNNDWVKRHETFLKNPDSKKDLKLVWFAVGKDDFLLNTNNDTVSMLKDHGFQVISQETKGGHTWTNWRQYLSEFVPKLFTEN